MPCIKVCISVFTSIKLADIPQFEGYFPLVMKEGINDKKLEIKQFLHVNGSYDVLHRFGNA